MNKLKVLLVDDEYLALDLLENFVNKLPDLEIDLHPYPDGMDQRPLQEGANES